MFKTALNSMQEEFFGPKSHIFLENVAYVLFIFFGNNYVLKEFYAGQGFRFFTERKNATKIPGLFMVYKGKNHTKTPLGRNFTAKHISLVLSFFFISSTYFFQSYFTLISKEADSRVFMNNLRVKTPVLGKTPIIQKKI